MCRSIVVVFVVVASIPLARSPSHFFHIKDLSRPLLSRLHLSKRFLKNELCSPNIRRIRAPLVSFEARGNYKSGCISIERVLFLFVLFILYMIN